MARGVSKTKVYEAIKQRWLNLNPGKADRFCEGSPYYLKELNDNLVEPMYDRVQRSYQAGAGRELDKDMRALHSSAAMTYNLFGNRPAYLYDGETYRAYTVTYEKQLTALNPTAKAHLDACLSRRDELLLFEMKMTEWLSNSHDPLPASYFSSEKKYPDWDLFVGLKMTRDLFHTEAGKRAMLHGQNIWIRHSSLSMSMRSIMPCFTRGSFLLQRRSNSVSVYGPSAILRSLTILRSMISMRRQSRNCTRSSRHFVRV